LPGTGSRKERTYRELKARGVEFSIEMTKESWGTYATFKDPEGNLLQLLQFEGAM